MSIQVRSKTGRTYEAWFKESVLGSHVSAYVDYLSEHGYSANTIGFYLHSVAQRSLPCGSDTNARPQPTCM